MIAKQNYESMHAELQGILTKTVSEFGLRHGLGKVSDEGLQQSSTTMAQVAKHYLCFGFDIWPDYVHNDEHNNGDGNDGESVADQTLGISDEHQVITFKPKAAAPRMSRVAAAVAIGMTLGAMAPVSLASAGPRHHHHHYTPGDDGVRDAG